MIEKKAVQKAVQVGQVDKNDFICMFLLSKPIHYPQL